MSPLTDEQKREVEGRVEEFKRRHEANVRELMVDIVPAPVYIPIAPYAYGTALNMEYKDLKYSNPSPISAPDAAPPQA